MKTNSKSVLAIAVFCSVLAYCRPAHAYLDPGTGSMLLQALLAIFAGAIVSAGIFWRRLVDIVKGLFSREQNKDDTENE